MKIVIETIPHESQRYKTAGDWWIDADGTWQIRVSSMNDEVAEFLVAFHELVEMALCIDRGITEEEVTHFDRYWPEGDTEPGDDPNAPYYDEHQLATGLEHIMCDAMACRWADYSDKVDALP